MFMRIVRFRIENSQRERKKSLSDIGLTLKMGLFASKIVAERKREREKYTDKHNLKFVNGFRISILNFIYYTVDL